MNENEDLIIETPVNIDTIYQQDKALIDVMISTAKAYPRNIKRALDNAITIVTMDKETAEECTFSVPRGGKAITGPSVHLARIVAQCWGNMRIETKVVSVGDKTVTSQGVAFDIESNIAIKVEVQRSIMTKFGRMSEDMIVVTGNAGNAIALRNAIFSVVSKAFWKRIHKESQTMLLGDIATEAKLNTKRTKVFTRLREAFSVTNEEIFVVIGKTDMSQVTPDDLVTLMGVGTAIKDGDTTVDQAFKRNKPSTTKEDIDAKKSNMKAGGSGKVEMP